MKNKKIKPLVILTIMVLVLASIGIIFYARENKNKEILKVDQKVSDEELKTSEIDEDISDDIQEENSIEFNENKENKEVSNTSVEKNDNANKQTSTNKQTTNDSSNKKTESNKSTTNDKEPTESKKLTKKEIEDYIHTTVPDFRYDFDSVKECQEEGDQWMKYGWRYDCPTVKVPNVDVVPTMLVITTGKYFCDGAYTKNEKYDYRKPKISSLEYLRSIGYPCANIEDN